MEFIKNARDLEIFTIKKAANFPKRYRFFCGTEIAETASSIHKYAKDGYLIHESKEYLQHCLACIKQICKELGITLNEKKTQIIKLSHGFTFLKCRLYLTPTGKVVKKIYKRSVNKMRRKLKGFKKLTAEGKMTYMDVYQAFQSWRSYALRFDAWHTIKAMEHLYNQLFIYCPD